jgi:prevent-host-death family protein
MEEIVSAADANRSFSLLLRGVREGRSYVVTSHGRPVARLIPAGKHRNVVLGARAALLSRLESQPVVNAGRWTREELYEDGWSMRVALDTNLLAYAEGMNGAERRDAAVAIIRQLPQEATIVPAQVLGELFNVLVRKGGRARTSARDALLTWRDTFPVFETSPEVVLRAASLAADHQLGIWDAVILAAASDAGCRLLLSEDLQEGFTWAGVTVVNPFASPQHPLLAALLHGDDDSEW